MNDPETSPVPCARAARKRWIPTASIARPKPAPSRRSPPPAAGSDALPELGRCASINNFWCLKTPGGAQWKGQIGADASGHAAFVDPVYSARAFARLMRIYRFRHDLVTVREMARRYAPPGDCIGSLSFCPVSDDVKSGRTGPSGRSVIK